MKKHPQSPRVHTKNEGHKARKRFGQNFLHDPKIIDSIVHHINPQEGENVVEIGPGLGALTTGLLEGAKKLTIIELDRDLIPRLQVKFDRQPVTIHNADALEFDFSQLGSVEDKLRLVGNLPYNISTPLIFHLLSFAEQVQDMHFMLQKEVVDRLSASPGEKNYGRLSVMVQYHCQVDALIKVGPGAFSPPPKVESAVVRLAPRPPELVCNNMSLLNQIVTQVFSQRRKTIRNGLKQILTAEQIEEIGLDPSTRPENLSNKDFVTLANWANDQNTTA